METTRCAAILNRYEHISLYTYTKQKNTHTIIYFRFLVFISTFLIGCFDIQPQGTLKHTKFCVYISIDHRTESVYKSYKNVYFPSSNQNSYCRLC